MSDHAPNDRRAAPASAPDQRFRHSRRARALLIVSLVAGLLAGCSGETPPVAGAGPASGDTPAPPTNGDTPAAAAPTNGDTPAAAAPTNVGTATTAIKAQSPVGVVCGLLGGGLGVIHDDGVGRRFCDPTPIGTYNEALAIAACESRDVVFGGLGTCTTIAGCTYGAAVAWEYVNSSPIAWGYAGTGRGHLAISNTMAVECPSASDNRSWI